MKNVFRQMQRAFSATPWKDRERNYLNDATSIVDLEMRMREIDSGRFKARF